MIEAILWMGGVLQQGNYDLVNEKFDKEVGDSVYNYRLMPEDEHFSIDGTVLQYANGRLYYIYCSVDDGVPMSLYIAPMSTPMKINGPRVLLRSPHSEWDNHGGAVNEGPFIVQNADRVFLVFS